MSDYQGYKNYPTWAVSLWLANEQGLYGLVQEQIEEGATPRQVADYIEELMTDADMGLAVELPTGPQSDICEWAMQQVDWDEVAEEQFEE